jgi:hypothetical protein
MAVAIDTTTGSIQESSSGSTSLTFSHTVSGSNTYLIVYCADLQGDTVTGVTYAGVSMTQLAKETRSPNAGSLEIYAYGLQNPTIGANNVIVSRSGTTATIDAVAYAFTGVNQSVTPNATGTANGGVSTRTSLTTSVTTTSNGCGITAWYVADNGSITAGTGLTIDATGGAGNRPAFASFRASTFPQVSSGSYSGTMNCSSGDVGGIMVALAPVSTNSNFFNFF